MKKTLIIATISLLIAGFSVQAHAADVNEKVLNSFNNAFPKAEQVKWQEFSDTYVVNFTSAGIWERIMYDKQGDFVSATRYFYEENLPANVVCKLKKRYPDHKVFGVTEVTTIESAYYYVKLEDKTSWTTVKTDNTGAIEVVEQLKKTQD